MEYTIWCDESDSNGKYYSDFYGGVLVKSIHYKEVNERLKKCRDKLAPNGEELKWTKVTSTYLETYKTIIDEFFTLVKEGKVKVRIMFRQAAYEVKSVPQEYKDKSFHLLYYQFIKHAFGLRYSNETGEFVNVRAYFDKLPDSLEKNELFKNHIYALQSINHLAEAKIRIRRDDIVEVNSKKHIELQCLDIVLGSMSFRLNNKHKVKPEGAKRRGKRTIAKEKLYKHIHNHINDLYKNFNVGVSTGYGSIGTKKARWEHPYRHWNFKPKDFVINKDKFK